VLSHENQLRNLTIFFGARPKFFKNSKTDKIFFWEKQKNTFLMILNDKAKCQISRILMKPRRIYDVKRSEKDSV
jgi:hypothetical protein